MRIPVEERATAGMHGSLRYTLSIVNPLFTAAEQ
jgi:hypothetical protein